MIDENVTKNFGFFDKIRYLFFKPSLFFDKIKEERGIKKAFIIYLTLTLLIILLLYFVPRFFTPKSYRFSESISTGIAITLYLIGIFWTFIYSFLIHIIVLIFNKSAKYEATYKAYTYSNIPFMFFMGITYLFTLLGNFFGISILFLIGISIGFFSLVYSIFLGIWGLSNLHNITKLKASIVILFPLIFFVLWYFSYIFR